MKITRNTRLFSILNAIVLVIVLSGCGSTHYASDRSASYTQSMTYKPSYTQSDTAKTMVSSATLGEQNALKSALSYLRLSSGFSRKGLIDQLEYEGYTTSEAEYAVDHCGANWKEQAAKSAAAYLRVSAFSKTGLIDQLEYEGFTHDQAVYGVEQNGY